MATQSVSANYSAITTIGDLERPFKDTVALFDCTLVETSLSAIDKYISNCRELNKLWVGQTTVSPELGRLLLLGYVSAIESYLRAIFRFIINTDLKAQSDSHSYPVPFGAALYHKKAVLAEALLEGYSFAGEGDIKKALSKFLGATQPSQDLKTTLAHFEHICQLRHCCVHRFGKLGSQNGIALGLAQHSKALEKPLVLDRQSIEEIASWLMSFAKALNNFLFKTILDRTIDASNPHRIVWTWSYAKDKKKFARLYRQFSTTLDSEPSPNLEEMYGRFKLAKRAVTERPRANAGKQG